MFSPTFVQTKEMTQYPQRPGCPLAAHGGLGLSGTDLQAWSQKRPRTGRQGTEWIQLRPEHCRRSKVCSGDVCQSPMATLKSNSNADVALPNIIALPIQALPNVIALPIQALSKNDRRRQEYVHDH